MTAVNDHCKQPSFFVVNDRGTAVYGRARSTLEKKTSNEEGMSTRERDGGTIAMTKLFIPPLNKSKPG
jgi:hypothetical protein